MVNGLSRVRPVVSIEEELIEGQSLILYILPIPSYHIANLQFIQITRFPLIHLSGYMIERSSLHFIMLLLPASHNKPLEDGDHLLLVILSQSKLEQLKEG